MSLRSQRRLAADVLGVGLNRVWIDPEQLTNVGSAITRQDIRRLIGSGIIKALPVKGVSRGRARVLKDKRKEGRRRGLGSREGNQYARSPKKDKWVATIRAVRDRLKVLRESKAITDATYHTLYKMAKGGAFKSVANLNQHIKSAGLVRRKQK
ncbi:MAG: 50S ribosomal protein L19e [Candidatus Bathyarchaeia archaeon]